MMRGRTLLASGIIAALAATAAAAGTISALNYNTPGGARTEIGGVLETLPGGILRLDTSTVKAATATAGAATLNTQMGAVTTEALTTASGGVYQLNLTDSTIAPADLVWATVQNGTNTAGGPHIGRVTAVAGGAAIEVRNASSASAAFNGTLVIKFGLIKN